MGRLRKQLQSVRNKLLQSEEREAIANEQIDTLQQSLAKQKAELQEAELRVSDYQRMRRLLSNLRCTCAAANCPLPGAPSLDHA